MEWECMKEDLFEKREQSIEMIKTIQIEWVWKGDIKWKTDDGEYGNGCLKKVNGFVLNELIMIEMPKP